MMITLHTTQNHLDKAGVYQGEYCSNTTSTLGQGVFLSLPSLPSFLTKEDAVQRSTSPRGRGGSLSHVCSSHHLIISKTSVPLTTLSSLGVQDRLLLFEKRKGWFKSLTYTSRETLAIITVLNCETK